MNPTTTYGWRCGHCRAHNNALWTVLDTAKASIERMNASPGPHIYVMTKTTTEDYTESSSKTRPELSSVF